MSNVFKPFRISDMIKELQQQKKEHGNLFVEMSIDEEGNAFHPIGNYIRKTKDKKEISIPFGIDGEKLIIYPCE